ncbi:hypothetical protein J7I88_07440 [Paraburkholderia strydomiana]|nr:hypothetical protein [Paraburkholderia strydomiana]
MNQLSHGKDGMASQAQEKRAANHECRADHCVIKRKTLLTGLRLVHAYGEAKRRKCGLHETPLLMNGGVIHELF